MGKKPDERQLREEGEEVLARVRERAGKLTLSKTEKRRLALTLGTTYENVDTLLSIEEGETP